MILCIADVVPQALRAEILACAGSAAFVDGRATAGWHAKLVKENEQLSGADPRHAELTGRLARAIEEHPLFQAAARPRRLLPLLISRYGPGMRYGSHVDDAIMQGVRTDVSFTLFLSEPDSYEGGALVIEGTGGEQAIKLPAGSMVVYPSGALHRVEAVTEGVRLAAVGWAQSLVRDPARREILFDLDSTRRALFQRDGKSPAFDTLSKTLANLMRMWAET